MPPFSPEFSKNCLPRVLVIKLYMKCYCMDSSCTEGGGEFNEAKLQKQDSTKIGSYGVRCGINEGKQSLCLKTE